MIDLGTFGGMRIVEDPRMMPGAYFVKDAKGKILASGLGSTLMPHGDLNKGTQIVCSTSMYEAIKREVPEK